MRIYPLDFVQRTIPQKRMLHLHKLLPTNLQIAMFQIPKQIKRHRHRAIRRVLDRHNPMRHRPAQHRIKHILDRHLRDQRRPALAVVYRRLVRVRAIRTQVRYGSESVHGDGAGVGGVEGGKGEGVDMDTVVCVGMDVMYVC